MAKTKDGKRDGRELSYLDAISDARDYPMLTGYYSAMITGLVHAWRDDSLRDDLSPAQWDRRIMMDIDRVTKQFIKRREAMIGAMIDEEVCDE